MASASPLRNSTSISLPVWVSMIDVQPEAGATLSRTKDPFATCTVIEPPADEKVCGAVDVPVVGVGAAVGAGLGVEVGTGAAVDVGTGAAVGAGVGEAGVAPVEVPPGVVVLPAPPLSSGRSPAPPSSIPAALALSAR